MSDNSEVLSRLHAQPGSGWSSNLLNDLLGLHLDPSHRGNYSHRLYLLLSNHVPMSSVTFYKDLPDCHVLDHYGEPLFERELRTDFIRGRQAILSHFIEAHSWTVLTQRELFSIIGGVKVPQPFATHSLMLFPLQPAGLLLLELTRKSKEATDAQLAVLLSTFLTNFQPHLSLGSQRPSRSGSRLPYSPDTVKSLSDRQKRIHTLLAAGWKNKAIAKSLGYSESLIRKETMVIFEYYRVTHREELISTKDQMLTET